MDMAEFGNAAIRVVAPIIGIGIAGVFGACMALFIYVFYRRQADVGKSSAQLEAERQARRAWLATLDDEVSWYTDLFTDALIIAGLACALTVLAIISSSEASSPMVIFGLMACAFGSGRILSTYRDDSVSFSTFCMPTFGAVAAICSYEIGSVFAGIALALVVALVAIGIDLLMRWHQLKQQTADASPEAIIPADEAAT